MKINKIKNYLDCWDYSTEELLEMVSLIRQLKQNAKDYCVPKILKDQSLAMIFNGNSTRTRVSFEVATHQLGAHALYLTGGEHGELHLGKRETIKDSALVISSMVEGISMRWGDVDEIEEFAKYSSVPVFNMMDYMRHPTQTLCDLTTIIENLPEGKKLKDIKLTFIGSDDLGESSAGDLAKLLPRFGITVVMGCPENHAFDERFNMIDSNHDQERIRRTLEQRAQACEEGGGKIYSTHDPIEAVKGADFIYTGCFCYEGMENDNNFEYFNKIFIDAGFQVSEKLLSHCKGAKTMHYLPALRGKEMTDYAMDFEGSLLWKQAENRLHTQRGLMAYLMGSRTINEYKLVENTEAERLAVEKIKKMYETFGSEYTHK
ncbi:hypothetical protein G9F72_026565 [Clostridium estertheticum]|uniref:ornithine carbamoyltransferase n=1 Tax=Clostridium estertheticum TaxID=238834 RepID=UPI0013E9304C|nr:hypothetical protein [Clostridium estertheticum]MBZ9689837.1 hypothetical protein [Clostridium estertheticum]